MYLENVVVDAVEPQELGRFWESVVGGERLTDVPAGFETRLAVEDGPVLDLCFQRVGEAPSEPVRLHFDLVGGAEQASEVDRLLGLRARHRSGRRAVGGARRPGGQSLLRAGAPGGPRRHRPDRGAATDLR